MNVSQQNPDGSWSEAEPLGPQGKIAKLEFWLRGNGFTRIPNALARWDERKLGK
jgi:hypothetical protein